MKRIIKRVLSLVGMCSLFLSMFCVSTNATTPAISPNNYRHTACTSYHIRATASDGGAQLESVTKGANRTSPQTNSGSYVYNSNWSKMYTTGFDLGYAKNKWFCPKDRCYKPTTTIYLLPDINSTTSSKQIASNIYVEVRSVVSGYGLSYVRVRNGAYEGQFGYVVNAYIVQVNNS